MLSLELFTNMDKEKVKLEEGVLDKETIETGVCTHPAGHCYGSDGGSGIPENLKVAPGGGGTKEVWALDSKKEVVESKEVYLKCQYCGKLEFSYIKDESEKI